MFLGRREGGMGWAGGLGSVLSQRGDGAGIKPLGSIQSTILSPCGPDLDHAACLHLCLLNSMHVAVTTWNYSDGEWEGLLAQCMVASAVLTVSAAL